MMNYRSRGFTFAGMVSELYHISEIGGENIEGYCLVMFCLERNPLKNQRYECLMAFLPLIRGTCRDIKLCFVKENLRGLQRKMQKGSLEQTTKTVL